MAQPQGFFHGFVSFSARFHSNGFCIALMLFFCIELVGPRDKFLSPEIWYTSGGCNPDSRPLFCFVVVVCMCVFVRWSLSFHILCCACCKRHNITINNLTGLGPVRPLRLRHPPSRVTSPIIHVYNTHNKY